MVIAGESVGWGTFISSRPTAPRTSGEISERVLVISVLHNNLWVQELASGTVTQLTSDGQPGHGGMAAVINGNFDWGALTPPSHHSSHDYDFRGCF